MVTVELRDDLWADATQLPWGPEPGSHGRWRTRPYPVDRNSTSARGNWPKPLAPLDVRGGRNEDSATQPQEHPEAGEGAPAGPG